MSLFTKVVWGAERIVAAASSGASKIAREFARLPASVRLTQLPVDNKALWSVGDILEALELHEEGDFSESAKLAEAFGRDDRISACINTRTRALVGRNGATFTVVASEEGDQRRAGTVRDKVEKLWYRCFTETILTRILADVVKIGVSISRVHWVRDAATGGEWQPRLEPWDMRWVRWDLFRKCYVAATQEGEVEVRTGTGEWLIIEPGGWMSGAVRALALAFFFRAGSWRDWARWCEKHGLPILAIDEPANDATAGAQAANDKKTFFERLKKLGREGVLRLPKKADGKGGFSVQYVEPSTLSWPAFEAFLKRLDVCIAVFLLGQNLSTEVQGGSLAATVAQNRVRLDYLAADAEALTTAFREQVLMWWGRFNFDWWDDALTPWPQWNTTEPEDQKAKSATLMNVANALAAMKKGSVPVDERALLEQYGVPLLSLEEVKRLADEAAKRAADGAKKTPEKTPPKDEKTSDGAKEKDAADDAV